MCQSLGEEDQPVWFKRSMDSSGRSAGLGIELLNQSNYKMWKSCMESYLVGEELWAVVGGKDKDKPEDNEANAEALKKWITTNAKAIQQEGYW